MRFKKFLEAQLKPHSYREADADELIKILRENCMRSVRAAQAGDHIYRGTRSTYSGGVFDPSVGERKSQNTSNYYTMLMDTNPANADFPKRGKSFIASTNPAKAEGYQYGAAGDGVLLVLFPFDDTEVALANQDDIWDLDAKFNSIFDCDLNIADLNDFWADLIGDMMLRPSDVKSMGDMVEAIKQESAATVVARLRRNGFLSRVDRKGVSDERIVEEFVEELPKAYSYERMGCTLTKPDDLASETEVWFSGKCVGISLDRMGPINEEFGL